MAVRITSQAIGSVRGLSDEEAGERVQHRNSARPTTPSSSAPCRSRTSGGWAPRDGAGAAATAVSDRPGGRQPGLPVPRRSSYQQLTKDHSLRSGASGRWVAHSRPGPGAPVQQRDHPMFGAGDRRGAGHLLRFAWRRGTFSCWHPTGSPECWRTSSCCRFCAPRVVLRPWVDQMVDRGEPPGGIGQHHAIVIRIDSVDSNTGEHPVVQTAAGERS